MYGRERNMHEHRGDGRLVLYGKYGWRVVRGGSWYGSYPVNFRAAFRNYLSPENRDSSTSGFVAPQDRSSIPMHFYPITL